MMALYDTFARRSRRSTHQSETLYFLTSPTTQLLTTFHCCLVYIAFRSALFLCCFALLYGNVRSTAPPTKLSAPSPPSVVSRASAVCLWKEGCPLTFTRTPSGLRDGGHRSRRGMVGGLSSPPRTPARHVARPSIGATRIETPPAPGELWRPRYRNLHDAEGPSSITNQPAVRPEIPVMCRRM
jgi:hypothetical protein